MLTALHLVVFWCALRYAFSTCALKSSGSRKNIGNDACASRNADWHRESVNSARLAAAMLQTSMHEHADNDQRVQQNLSWEISDYFAWMRKLGAKIHPSLSTGSFMHGGAHVRGVLSSEALAHTAVLEIPRSLWITGAEAPPQVLKLVSTSDVCQGVGTDTVNQAIVLYLESQKGTQSKWHHFISGCPTFAEFEAQAVQLADKQLLNDFAGLTGFMLLFEDAMARLEQKLDCLQFVRRQDARLAGMSREDMIRWSLVSITRRYGIPGFGDFESALIPVAELMNTANGNDQNTEWGVMSGSDVFQMTATSQPRDEILINYCVDCPNQRLMLTWGFYLDGNPNRATSAGASADVDCNAVRGATEAALNLDLGRLVGARAQQKAEGPQCRVADGKRCNLARLALELCVETWSRQRNAHSAEVSLTEVERISGSKGKSPETEMQELENTAIGGLVSK